MLMLVFLKITADLALYFTFAGFLAVVYGAWSGFVFGSVLLGAAVFTVSYALKDKGWARFVPLVFGIIGGLAGASSIAECVVVIPAAVYIWYLAGKEVYEPDRYSQMGIFSVFWKVFLAFGLLMTVAGKAEEITAVSVPMGVLTMAASVLILRSLRHEPEVYLQRNYQMTNLLLVVCVVGLVLFLSSQMMVTLVVMTVKTLYQWVVLPVIMLVVYIFAVIVWLISKLFAFVKIKKLETDQQPQMQIMDVNQIFEGMVPGANHEELFAKILMGIGIVAAVIICILVFRMLANRDREVRKVSGVRDERTKTVIKREKTKHRSENTHVEIVREQYKRFLRMLAQQGVVTEKAHTSLDVQKQYRRVERSEEIDGKLADELRQIYIAARYGQDAGAQEAQRAKEICSEIKKIVGN